MCETTWNHWENPEEGFHEISFFIIAQYAFEEGGGEIARGGGSHKEGGEVTQGEEGR